MEVTFHKQNSNPNLITGVQFQAIMTKSAK